MLGFIMQRYNCGIIPVDAVLTTLDGLPSIGVLGNEDVECREEFELDNSLEFGESTPWRSMRCLT